MKTRMSENSLQTYDKLLQELPKKRMIVARVFLNEKRKLTAFDIAEILGVSIHHIVGRINELRFIDNLIVKDEYVIVGGNKRSLYRLREDGEFPDVRNESSIDKVEKLLKEMENKLKDCSEKNDCPSYISTTDKYLKRLLDVVEHKK